MDERGSGHYNYINKIMYMLFVNDNTNILRLKKEDEKKKYIEKHFTNKLIVNYLVEILINFTIFEKDGALNIREYLDNIFIHIVDIFGFITSYIPMYELFYKNFNRLNKKQLLILTNLKYIFIEFLYKPRIQVIDIDDLVNNLKNINKLIYKKNISNKLNNFRKNKNSFTRKNFKK